MEFELVELLIIFLGVFLAGVGVGTFVVGSTVRRVIREARAEFTDMRHAAEAKITEAENVIRQARKV